MVSAFLITGHNFLHAEPHVFTNLQIAENLETLLKWTYQVELIARKSQDLELFPYKLLFQCIVSQVVHGG